MEKVIYTYNKLFYDFLKDLRDADPSLKNKIRSEYKVKNYTTQENMELFAVAMEQEKLITDIATMSSDELMELSKFKSISIVKGVTMEDITNVISKDYRSTLLSYLYIFTLLHIIWTNVAASDLSIMFQTVMTCVKHIQDGEAYDTCANTIIDDDISNVLDKLHKVCSKSSVKIEDGEEPSMTPEFLESTKIGSLAKEISSEINLSDMKIEKPEDILNLANNNMIGDIVSKVGSKIHEKLDKGELKHEELLSEAMSLLSVFSNNKGMFNNPMFKDIMKAAGGGGKGAKVNEGKLKAMSARDRLRRKHEERKH
jgi:hypothetical protein